MNRRKFIKNSAGIFIPLVFIPRLIRAQAFSSRDAAFIGSTIVPSSSGGGDYTTGLILDLDADSLSGIDGSAVTSWTDLISSLVFNADLGFRPTFTNSVIALNNHKAVTFSGTVDYMYNTTMSSSASNYTIIAIVVPSDGAVSLTECLFSTTPSSGPNNFSLQLNNGSNQVGWYDGSTHGSAANTTGAQCLSWALNSTGTAGAIYRNGSQLGSSDTYTQVSCGNQTVIGAFRNGAIQQGNFTLARFRIYNSALSTGNRTLAENFLRTKYGL